MTRILWAPQALEGLQSIRTYLARDSTQYADLVIEQIIHNVDRLELHPRSGRVVPELGRSSIRELIVRNYRIVYEFARDEVFILTIFHGARSFPPRRRSRRDTR